MKKIILLLFIYTISNSIFSQSNCESNPDYFISNQMEYGKKVDLKFIHIDNSFTFVISKNKKDGADISLLDSNLKKIKEISIPTPPHTIKDIVKRNNRYYFYINIFNKKSIEFHLKIYDLDLNNIDNKFITKVHKEKFQKRKFYLASIETKNGLDMDAFEFYDNKEKFKITSVKDKKVFVNLFDSEGNELHKYSYNPTKGIRFGFKTIRSILGYTSSEGNHYSIFAVFKPKAIMGSSKHTFIRKISTDGSVIINEINFDDTQKIRNKKVIETNNKISFVYPSGNSNKKNTINALKKVTFDKESLVFDSNISIPLRKEFKVSKILFKHIQEKNNLYTSIESIDVFVNEKNITHSSASDIYIAKLNLDTNKIEWTTKIKNKNNRGGRYLAYNIDSVYSWALKDNHILIALNSRNNVKTKGFNTGGYGIDNLNLYILELSTVSGKFCYKKLFNSKDSKINFWGSYGKSFDSTFFLYGKSSSNKKKQYKFLKF